MSSDEALWWLLGLDSQASGVSSAASSVRRDAGAEAPLLNPGIARLFVATQDDGVPSAVKAVLSVPAWRSCDAPAGLDLPAALARSGAMAQLGKRAKRRLQRQMPTKLQYAEPCEQADGARALSLFDLLAQSTNTEALVLLSEHEPVALLREQWPALQHLSRSAMAERERASVLQASLTALSNRDHKAIAGHQFVIRSNPWLPAGSGAGRRTLSVALNGYGEQVSGADLLERLAARDDYDAVLFNDRDDAHRVRELPEVTWGPSVARTLLAGQSALGLEETCLGPVLVTLVEHDHFFLPRWLRPVTAQDRIWAAQCLQLLTTHADSFAALCAKSADANIARRDMHSIDGSRLLRHLEHPLNVPWWLALARRAERARRTRFVLGIW